MTHAATASGTVEYVGSMIPTLPPAGTTTYSNGQTIANTVGPSLRVGVTSDHRAAVLMAPATYTGLSVDGLTELIARATEARAILQSADL